jgi:hypothetical protein
MRTDWPVKAHQVSFEIVLFRFTINAKTWAFRTDELEVKSFGSPNTFGFLMNERMVGGPKRSELWRVYVDAFSRGVSLKAAGSFPEIVLL